MTAKARLTESKAALLLNQPFFASLMLDMMTVELGTFPQVFAGRTPTMATNGKTIWIDEEFILSLSVNQAVFVLCHEIGHAMWTHMRRGKQYADMGFDGRPFNHKCWNFAGDYVINDMLTKAEIGKMPKGGLLDPKYQYTDMVDDVYRKLLEDQDECPQCGGSGREDGDGGDEEGEGEGGSGGEDGDQPCSSCGGSGTGDMEGDTLDTHVNETVEEPVSDAQWRRAVASAKDAAKAMGQMPAHLERAVETLLDARVPWEDKLRKSMAKKIGKDTTNWSRPHRRRYITQGIIMPTYQGFGAGHIIFCVDTSGSMSDKELAQALGECDKILADCNPERVTLIGCDARVETVLELVDGDRLADNIPRIGGGGGTSFIPPFEWVKEQGVRPDTLVYFTDTGGTFPTDDPGFPVIWCCSQDWCEPPFGEIIRAEVFE